MAFNNFSSCVGPSYHLDDRKAAVQTSINCYLEQVEGQGESRTLTQVSAPGLAQGLNLGAEIRGQRNVEGRWFVVSGSSLIEIVAGAAVVRGTLASITGTVAMIHNNTQLTIVDGLNGYVLALATNVLTKIVSAGWRGSYTASFIDGYTIFVTPAADQFYISKIDDSSNLNALDFSSADAQPDNVVTSLVLHRELVLMGVYTTEIWLDSGKAAFPFQRYNRTDRRWVRWQECGNRRLRFNLLDRADSHWIRDYLQDDRAHPATGIDSRH
jgi:hypothetical protein